MIQIDRYKRVPLLHPGRLIQKGSGLVKFAQLIVSCTLSFIEMSKMAILFRAFLVISINMYTVLSA